MKLVGKIFKYALVLAAIAGGLYLTYWFILLLLGIVIACVLVTNLDSGYDAPIDDYEAEPEDEVYYGGDGYYYKRKR